MKLSKDFQHGMSVKALYWTLVSPVLKYDSVFWDPHSGNDSSRLLKQVQRKFLSFASYILKIPCPPLDYTPVTNALDLFYLAERRHTADIKFVVVLLNGKIESSEMLYLICFRVPQSSTWSTSLLYFPHDSTNYLANK